VSIESQSMHVKARSYLTAGIATLGVGAIALAPVQPIPNQIALAPHRAVSTLAVELASTIDPITPWVDTFTTAGANIGTLVEFYLQKPFPILQTIGANWGTYFEELGNGNAGLIPEQIWGNVQTFFQAPWSPGEQVEFPVGPAPQTVVKLPGDDANLVPTYISETTPADGSNSPPNLYLGLVILGVEQAASPKCSVDGDCLLEQLAPLLNFFATNYSGQLLGLLGPLLAPVVVLTRSFTAIGEFFQEGDVIGAINELINIPANVTNGVLNGAGFLDLTAIVTAIAPLPIEGIKLGLNTGGLLNSVPKDGSLVPDAPNPPTEYSGGIALDSLAVQSDNTLFKTAGLPNGWAGSVVGLGQFLGEQLVVTPPAPPPPPPPVAAEPASAKQAAPLDIQAPATTEAPAEDAAPAVVDVPAEESEPAVAEVVAEDPAPVVEDIAEVGAEVEAAVEAVEASESEPAEAATPAAEDSGPEAADSDKSDDDTGRSGGNDRRGAS
jgi:hypothetical protein